MITKEEYEARLQWYATNKHGRVALCATCAYTGGYCLKGLRFYRCNDYVMDKDVEAYLRTTSSYNSENTYSK